MKLGKIKDKVSGALSYAFNTLVTRKNGDAAAFFGWSAVGGLILTASLINRLRPPVMTAFELASGSLPHITLTPSMVAAALTSLAATGAFAAISHRSAKQHHEERKELAQKYKDFTAFVQSRVPARPQPSL
jgi:hypothetical protein